MSYVAPDRIVDAAISAGVSRAEQPVSQMVVRGILAGAILACATTVAFTASIQTGLPIVGALIFPVGFVIIVLLGTELVTGNFALIPLAVLEGRTSTALMLKNFFFVIVGHLIGCALYLLLYVAVITKMGTESSDPMIAQIIAVAEGKTLGYAALGGSGLALVFIKAVLCNWMVTLGAVLALSSASVSGKIMAMWLPVTMFFSLGFEHAVVNMFVIPAGMLLGADVSLAEWWGWNQLPVLAGNFLGGVALTGALFYFSHRRRITRQTLVTTAQPPVGELTSDAAREPAQTFSR
ncbi:formate/nitrite transporter [Microterricola gilva]|uniref:Formate/nitrite transporter n=1 Tax=Microterricola gilva TaxID=393267 RepID=A0A4V2GAM1_9MICO|nr:formate/nitrite transporter family protein [Microterricola gilva]RZU64766.1 formate/nitrite transporter [Microterricola gilva]